VRARDYDPTGERHGGIPTYPWRWAPDGLKTRRQLRAMGLRPGGHDPVAQIVCRRGKRFAWLYDLALAVPKLPMTPAKQAALDRAMAARQTCPDCGRRYEACLPLKTLGSCWFCAEGAEDAACARRNP
jgi:hypothetical protein